MLIVLKHQLSIFISNINYKVLQT